MNKILVSPSSFGECGSEPIDILKKAGFEVVPNPYGRKLTENETISLGSEVVGAIAGVETYNSVVLDKLPNLKCISRVGVGIDSIDLKYAKEKGIELCITPNGPTQAVAELSITFALNLLRRISVSDRRIRNNVWKKETGNLMTGKTVGIVGLGRIGKKTASLYQALGCSVIAYDKYPDSGWMESNNVVCVTFERLIKNADIISIHIPGMEDGEHLIDTRELQQMKPNCIIINLSRGGLINEEALFIHLKEHHEFFAALDVFLDEPYKGALVELDNILLTPHIGSYAKEAKLAMEIDAVNNLINYFDSSFKKVI
jgi:D-3-phosphoglycerate dehydrogenase